MGLRVLGSWSLVRFGDASAPIVVKAAGTTKARRHEEITTKKDSTLTEDLLFRVFVFSWLHLFFRSYCQESPRSTVSDDWRIA